MKATWLSGISFILLGAAGVAYGAFQVDSCSGLAWQACPENGSRGKCPSGNKHCTWVTEYEKTVDITLCSCHTPNCGNEECNRQLTWRVRLFKWKCIPDGELEPCIRHETTLCAEYPPLQVGPQDRNCNGETCTGPCQNVVTPPPAPPPSS